MFDKDTKIKSLFDLFEMFPDENSAIKYFEGRRWKNGITCPLCGCKKIYSFSKPGQYKCSECRKRFSIRKGSIFESSKISMRKWLAAVYLYTVHKKGLSGCQMAVDIGVTQKTAWFIIHRLNYVFEKRQNQELPLEGEIEIDETYVGGLEKNKHFDKKAKTLGLDTRGRSLTVKSGLVALVQRGGSVRIFKVNGVSEDEIHPLILDNVVPGSVIHTDEWKAYNNLHYLYDHRIVNHGNKEYVSGSNYTNTVECVFSRLKNTLKGTHHHCSPKHLHRYSAAIAVRFSFRNFTEQRLFDLVFEHCECRLTYQKLVA